MILDVDEYFKTLSLKELGSFVNVNDALKELINNPNTDLISYRKNEELKMENLLKDENGNSYIEYAIIRECDLLSGFKFHVVGELSNDDVTMELIISKRKKINLHENQIINLLGTAYVTLDVRFTFKKVSPCIIHFSYDQYLAQTDIRRKLCQEPTTTGKIRYNVIRGIVDIVE